MVYVDEVSTYLYTQKNFVGNEFLTTVKNNKFIQLSTDNKYADMTKNFFNGCKNLVDVQDELFTIQYIKYNSLTNTGNISLGGTFKGCEKLTKLPNTLFKISQCNNMPYIKINCGNFVQGCKSLKNVDNIRFVDGNTEIKKITITCDYMFYGTGLTSIPNILLSSNNNDNLNYFIDSASYMFAYTQISNITEFPNNIRYPVSYMFAGCDKLTDISQKAYKTIFNIIYNFKHASQAVYMFGDCHNIKSIYVYITKDTHNNLYNKMFAGLTKTNSENFTDVYFIELPDDLPQNNSDIYGMFNYKYNINLHNTKSYKDTDVLRWLQLDVNS